MVKKPLEITEQIMVLAKMFGLNATHALKFAKNLPPLQSFVPKDAQPWVRYFAVLYEGSRLATHGHFKEDASSAYCHAVGLVHKKISIFRPFHKVFEEDLTPKNLRMESTTVQALKKMSEKQEGDILIIAAQLGVYRHNRSHRSCITFARNEFGLGSLSVGSIILTRADRLAINVDCPGDKASPGGGFSFSCIPNYRENHTGGIEYGISWKGDLGKNYGSASGFLIP